MPAGIVIKTPNSGRAKNANNNSSNNNNNGGGGSSGKKFVQTRLPFKLIAPVATTSGAAATAAAAIDLPDVEREPRKRKLSYGPETESEKEPDAAAGEEGQLRRSNSKENLLTAANKKPKTTATSEEHDCIELIDDDDDDDDVEVEETAPVKVKAKEKAAEATTPVQIKLPLHNKRAKRRKSLKKTETPTVPAASVERSDSSDDIEEIAEQLNPQKRAKVLEPTMDVETDEPLAESDSEPKAAEPAAVIVAELSSTDIEQETEKQQQKTEKQQQQKAEKQQQETATETETEKPQQLTAKQQKLMEQRRKAREEKERKLQEERTLKQQEKEQREQQKKAEREQKEEQRRKEREDKELAKRQEREEKERKRQAEVDKKDEEKRKRNEAKEEVQRKKDDERRRKEQEKQEAEQKKQRAAASFTKFFVPKQPRPSAGNGGGDALDQDQNSCDSGPSNGHSQTLAFRPFQVKEDMILAPVIRTTIAKETRRQLDRLFHDKDEDDADDDDEDLNESIGRVKRPTRNQLYIAQLNQGKHKPLGSKRDVRLQRRAKDDDEDDDVQIVDELANAGTPIVEERAKQLPWVRAKYLHFADNRRPPFYGTWRKRSQLIKPRRPLGQDKTYFDYEVDSDCEWEEEEPGESLSASEDEKERESEEESEEEYNEWFVPHGHLSDEELQNDGELEDGNTREAQKAKLQVLQQEFAQEMKKQTKKIKPRLLGPFWLDENGNKSESFPAIFTQIIDMYGCWQLEPLTLEPPPETVRDEEPLEVKTVLQLDETLLQQLVRLIHGNSNSKVFLISEYLEYLKTQITQESVTLPPKTLLREKFDELASWKPVVVDTSGDVAAKKLKKPKKRLCWVVSPEMLQKYQLAELTLQNQWNYTLTPKVSKADTSLHEPTPPPTAEAVADVNGTPKTDSSKKAKRGESLPSTPTTTTTTASPATATGTATATATTTAASGTKKRATLLMSVGRDQQFHTPTKNALISQYLRKQNAADSASAEKKKPSRAPPPVTSGDDVVLLSD